MTLKEVKNKKFHGAMSRALAKKRRGPAANKALERLRKLEVEV